MSNERRIRITLEDDASPRVNRMTQSIEQDLGKVHDAFEGIDEVVEGLIEDSEKYSNSIRDRIRWVEKEVQLQQRNARIDNLERRSKLDYERRIGQEKGQWSRKDEDIYRRRRGMLDQERRDETLYYEKMRARLQERTTRMSAGGRGRRGGLGGGFGDRFEQYLHDAGRMDRGLPPSDGGGEDGEGGGGDGRGGGRRRGVWSRISGGFRAAGNGALAAAGFGAVLSIAGFVGKMIDEAKQLDQNKKKLSGATGQTGMGGALYGLKESEVMDYTRQVSTLRGQASIKEARSQLGLEKAFGMDIGSTNQFNKVMRLDHSQTLTDATVDMLNIMKKTDLYNIKRSDFSQLHELMERQNNLNELQAGQMEEISARESSLIMATMGKIGGSFGDIRQTDTLGKINQSITNPGNDFKQAFLFRALRQQNPEGTFLDLKMRQEEGIFGKGTLGAVMGNLSKTFTGDQLTFSTSKMLGLNLHQSKRLQDYYSKNPNAFDNMSFDSEEDFKKFVDGKGNFSRKSISQRAGAHTGTIEGWSSEFDTWMGRKGDKAVQYVNELKGEYDKGGFSGFAAKLGSDIVTAIKDGFNAINPLAEGSEARKAMLNAQGQQSKNILEDKEVQSDFYNSINKMSQEDIDKYISGDAADYLRNARTGGNMGAFKNYVSDMFNTDNATQYAKMVGEALAKYMPEKYKGTDEEGKILKVEVVNQKGSVPKNTTHKGDDN